MGQLTAVFEKTDEWWVAYIEELPGVNTQGKTLEEARENLQEGSRHSIWWKPAIRNISSVPRHTVAPQGTVDERVG